MVGVFATDECVSRFADDTVISPIGYDEPMNQWCVIFTIDTLLHRW